MAISTFKSVIFRGVPRVLPLLRALSKPALVLLRMLSSSCCAAQVKKLARTSPITASGESRIGVEVTRPMLLRWGKGPDPHLAAAQVPEGADRVHPAPAYAVHRGDHQERPPGPRAGVQGTPALPAVGPCGAGDPHVPVYEVRWHAGVAELEDLGLGVATRLALSLSPAGPYVTINPAHSITIPFCTTQLLAGNVSGVPTHKNARFCAPY